MIHNDDWFILFSNASSNRPEQDRAGRTDEMEDRMKRGTSSDR